MGFVFWPPSLLGCGGRLIPKKVEIYTEESYTRIYMYYIYIYMYFSSLGFVLWPPSLLGCGGRLIPKKVEMYTKQSYTRIYNMYIYIYIYVLYIMHIYTIFHIVFNIVSRFDRLLCEM